MRWGLLKGIAAIRCDSFSFLFFEFRGRVSPRRATYFLLLRQKNVSKEKATPLSATPALRYGATCGARGSRGLAELAFGSNSCEP